MYGKPHLDTNAHYYACAHAFNDMRALADDKSLSGHQQLLARQSRDLIAALANSLKEFPQ